MHIPGDLICVTHTQVTRESINQIIRSVAAFRELVLEVESRDESSQSYQGPNELRLEFDHDARTDAGIQLGSAW